MSYRQRFSPEIAALLADDAWLVAEEGYDPAQNLAYESIFGLASGAMGNRGSHEEGGIRKTLPANYVHGVFDQSEAFMRELCNTPDWTKLRLCHACEPISLEDGEPRDYLRVLDMRHGLLAKRYVNRAADGRETRIESLKFLSRAHPRCGMFRLCLTPLNYEGVLELENLIDAAVTNFMDMPRFRVRHLETTEVSALMPDGCYVGSKTRDFGLPLGTGARVTVRDACGADRVKSRRFRPFGELACEFLDADMTRGDTLTIEKFACICTGRDFDDPRAQVARELEALALRGFDAELAAHIARYDALWAMADVEIDGDDALQHALRFNIFQLMSTPAQDDPHTNIGAKMIHGEEYGGHAFWDTELFVLPFFDYVFPGVARNLVTYRYLLLDKALENAEKNGYRGAKYPWESADTGEEECPAWTVCPDGSCYRCYVADYEHHVTAAVAYGAQHYAHITGDEAFMDEMGLEILLQTARFWASRAVYKPEYDRYEILRVTGPDEWHEPVDNTAYTNHLARWNIDCALDRLARCRQEKPEVCARLWAALGLTEAELMEWKTCASKLYIKTRQGLIEQFDGYFDLPDAVITEWDACGMPRMPAIFREKRGMQHCILKQADVVMLMFLMPYVYDMETQRINYDYYEQRTLHRSSLSPSIHCLMGLRVGDAKRAYAYLERSAYVDIRNNQGNTREGLHAASAGGTWQCVTLGYCGMSVDDSGELVFTPHLPARWTRVRYRIVWRGTPLHITVTPGDVRIRANGALVPYRVNGESRVSEW
ncbi:MAG: glycoside hydrolase family 65 protein [Oscillospiraceae bacterium]|jgi:kojibiose phosphorylase|nr:glycoside hydrolase family 65 protein [Oscillospiraceae bacterium]